MPQGQFPGILPGQDLTATLLNELGPLNAWKTSSTSYSNNVSSPANDPDLTLPVVANATYAVEFYVAYVAGSSTANTNNAGGFGFSVPSGATLALNGIYYAGGAVNLSGNGATVMRDVDGKETTTLPIILFGTLVTGGTAGSITAQFGEVSGAGGPMVVEAGSRIALQRMQ